MPTITRYYPFIWGISRQETASVESVDDLYLVPWLAHIIRDPGWLRLSMSRGGSEVLLMAEWHRGRRSAIVGHLDAAVPGLPDWRPMYKWTALVPEDLPTKRLVVRSTAFDCRARAEAFEWSPLERISGSSQTISVWDSVVNDMDHGGYVSVAAREHEIELRARDAEDALPTELDRTTAFLVHMLNMRWPLRWKATSLDEDSDQESQSVSGDARQLAEHLRCF